MVFAPHEQVVLYLQASRHRQYMNVCENANLCKWCNMSVLHFFARFWISRELDGISQCKVVDGPNHPSQHHNGTHIYCFYNV